MPMTNSATVVGVTNGPDHGGDAQLVDAVGVGNRRVLRSVVRVTDETLEAGAPRPGRHVDLVDDERRRHQATRLPPGEASREDVDDEADVDDARPRRAIQSWSSRVATKLRLTRSGARRSVESAWVVKRRLARTPWRLMSLATWSRPQSRPRRLAALVSFRLPQTE
jgi:hypothetical protein